MVNDANHHSTIKRDLLTPWDFAYVLTLQDIFFKFIQASLEIRTGFNLPFLWAKVVTNVNFAMGRSMWMLTDLVLKRKWPRERCQMSHFKAFVSLTVFKSFKNLSCLDRMWSSCERRTSSPESMCLPQLLETGTRCGIDQDCWFLHL